ncbi:glycosyltransferase family 20-domain-containing protein [Ostreococcus tauri]|uniref:alpha,alpha-trehalose-phosphate synthase (UDP-forming) n=1 Tax=Ostreococcus tauri TaxID=70448 RepID=A0A1Y5I3R9_OSTTA|nr:glycosyltransferase family 20-domain-containing protein [Ostreococcus tauri]
MPADGSTPESPPRRSRAFADVPDAATPFTSPRRRSVDASASPIRHVDSEIFARASRASMSSLNAMSTDGSMYDLTRRMEGLAGSAVFDAQGQQSEELESTRVDRLLRERAEQLKRTRSQTNLVSGEIAEESAVFEEEEPVRESLIIAANRLPVSVKRKADGTWDVRPSAGGLVSALLGVRKTYGMTWIGWPGVFIEPGPERDSLTATLRRQNLLPVYLTKSQVELYYNGYCNNVLWSLFHYVPLNFEARLNQETNMTAQWVAYKEANRVFADAIMSVYRDGDIVWAHDYHLMLVPEMLRQDVETMKIGWFLHTPFPSSEIYRMLPMREALLHGCLAADLVGFHTYDYARHFVSATSRILGLEATPDGVETQGGFTRVAAFPIGIDPSRFTAALRTDQVQDHIKELQERFRGRKVMLGVDRLDMIKGIPHKLLAFEKFLIENPEWKDKCCLIQIAVPTRSEVPEYQKLASTVHEIVGRINGRFGSIGSIPIQHLDCSMQFPELCALYSVTDVMLVTSQRDGMNLVSYEFVSCQNKSNAGVLVLSEFAGAAQSIGAGALLVNPHNVTEVAHAIKEALTMPEAEKIERHRSSFSHVSTHTAQAWADTFISELNDTHVEAELRQKRIPPHLSPDVVTRSFQKGKQRLIILGYNATLTDPMDSRSKNRPAIESKKNRHKIHPISQECISRLCDDPNTTVCIFSGSDRNKLAQIFAMLPKVWIAAENGVFIRPPLQGKNGTETPKWMTMIETTNLDWLESVEVVFEYFCERTPRSHVETRETSLVWSYKYADPDFGRQQARDLLQHLWTGPISNAPVDVVMGAKSVEVRPVGLSKGTAVERILHIINGGKNKELIEVDFVACFGHFLGRDEDIFSFLEQNSSQNSLSTNAHSPGSKKGNTSLSASIQNDLAAVEEHDESNLKKKHEAEIRFQDIVTCTVGRKRSSARYFVNDSDEVALCLAALTNSLNDGKGVIELLQFEDSVSNVSKSASRGNLSTGRAASLPGGDNDAVYRSSSGQSI